MTGYPPPPVMHGLVAIIEHNDYDGFMMGLFRATWPGIRFEPPAEPDYRAFLEYQDTQIARAMGLPQSLTAPPFPPAPAPPTPPDAPG